MLITVEKMGSNANMLVPVPITKDIGVKDKNRACPNMSLLNAQSILDKDGAIVYYFLSNNINIAIITESWQQSTIPTNRQDRTSGGILLVHKKSYKANLLPKRYLQVPFKLPSSGYR